MGWLRPVAIRTRREAERDLFARGSYPTGTIPVWAIDRNGRVDFSRPIRRLSEADALVLLRPAPVQRSPDFDPAPNPPTGWFARLAAFISILMRKV